MRLAVRLAVSIFVTMLSAFAQTGNEQATADQALVAQVAEQGSVPKLVKFSGVLRDADGKPVTTSTNLTFAVYRTQDDMSALWMETRAVWPDAEGRYTVLLGATKSEGIDSSIFASGEARYVGVQIEGQPELARMLMVSVPYALKAADAERLAGFGIGDFLLTRAARERLAASAGSASAQQALEETFGAVSATTSTANFIPKFTGTDTIANSILYDNGSAIGFGTTSPGAKMHLKGTGHMMRLDPDTTSQNLVEFYRNGSPKWLWYMTSTDDFRFWDTTDRVTFRSGGNVGIGTTTPGAKLHITGTGSMLRLDPNTTSQNLAEFYLNGVPKWLWYLNSNGDFRFWDTTDRFVLQAGGNVGIGMTNPTQKLDVNGIIRSGAGGFMFPDNSVQTTAALGDITNVIAGTGLSGGATSGEATLSVNTSLIQSRVSGSCPAGQYIRTVNADGTVVCGTDSGGASSGTVTSISAGDGLSGGTITSSGTLAVDATVARRNSGNVFTTNQTITGNLTVFSTNVKVPNESSIGTQQSHLAALDGNRARITVGGENYGILGVVVAGAGTTGDAEVAISGVANCQFAGNTLAGNYVQMNPVVFGRCYDVGSSYPTSGQVVGRVLATTTGSAIVPVMLFGPEVRGGSSISSVSAGNGLTGGGSTGNVSLSISSCPNNQILKSNGGTWSCALDVDTNSGGTVMSITAGSGLTGGTITDDGTIAVDSSVARKDIDNNFTVNQTFASDISVADRIQAQSGNFVGQGGVTGHDQREEGETTGVKGIVDSAEGVGVKGQGITRGVLGVVTGAGAGVYGRGATSAFGESFGLRGVANSGHAAGVRGDLFAVDAETTITTGAGVLGTFGYVSETEQEGNPNAHNGAGVHGKNVANAGFGVIGDAMGPGESYGVLGRVNTADGAGGVFQNLNTSGTLIIGRADGNDVFKVDGSGNVWAAGYLDQFGNPTNFINSINAGIGLFVSQMGSSVSIAVSPDVALRGVNNMFTADQSVEGKVIAAGDTSIELNPTTGTILMAANRFAYGAGNANNFFGTLAGNPSVSGSENTGVGREALTEVTTGSLNTAVGRGAMKAVTTAQGNTAVGTNTMLVLTSDGIGNVALGNEAMQGLTTGNNNIAIGQGALPVSFTTGTSNIGIGFAAGGGTTTSANNSIFIGSNARAGQDGLTNAIAIGTNAVVNESNTMILGNGVNVGINMGSPTEKLSVGGNILATGTVTASGGFSGNLSNANTIALPVTTTSSAGVITQDGQRFLHSYGGNNVFLGNQAGNFSLTGGNNTALGAFSLTNLSSGTSNVAVGQSALQANTSGASNTALGAQALLSNSNGQQNTAVGANAMLLTTTGQANTGVGAGVLAANSTGGLNAVLGGSAMGANTSGSGNVALGYNTLPNNTSGGSNIAIGTSAGSVNTTGSENIFIGQNARPSPGLNNLTNAIAIGSGAIVGASHSMVLGNNVNVGIGTSSPFEKLHVIGNIYTQGDITASSKLITSKLQVSGGIELHSGGGSGTQSIYLGLLSGNSIVNGFGNVAIGPGTLYNATTANQNIAIGDRALQATTTASGNVAVGIASLLNNTTGIANIALGTSALGQNTVGNGNIAIGGSAATNTTVSDNVAVGVAALGSNTTGTRNVALGNSALNGSITSSDNTAIGYRAYWLGTGANNTAVGANSGTGFSFSGNNTFLGKDAGSTSPGSGSGGNNTFVGYNSNADSGATNLSNVTVVGANAIVGVSNAVVLGDTSAKVGIGHGYPASKLDVSGGDVYVRTVGSGIILKATDNSSVCYRVTVNAAGDLTTAAVTCPL